ncbi:MAG: sigma-54-dependent Fis family transcriptional regulator [Lentihominibacter sp.]|jgi:transcriptional regulator with PAS, ATPase and Fis domain
MLLIDEKYLEKTKQLWQKYIASGMDFEASNLIKNGLREEIAYSWVRSKTSNLVPEALDDTKANPEEFVKILSKNDRLISIALPYLENILEKVSGSNYVVQLCDADGCVLKCLFDTDLVQDLSNVISPKREGYYVSEAKIGTASTGCALINDAPMQVVGHEHFQTRNHIFCCSSCPIHSKSGQIIGVLTVMALKETYHLHTLGMVCAAVDGIEKEIRLRDALDKESISNKMLSITINTMTNGVALINPQQEIIIHNEAFIDVLRLRSDSLQGENLYSLFDSNSIENSNIDFRDDNPATEVTLVNSDLQRINLVVKTSIIKDADGNPSATFISFDTQKNVHELATKIVGSKASYTVDSIIGESQEMEDIKELILDISESDSSVLITGESGTGKELVAQSIHNASSRASKPFVSINCGALPKNLIASELFGVEYGAFTGAAKNGTPGKFELANNGTLFLDEIGDMPAELQINLLRVLQEKEVTRLGASVAKQVDVRIIASTNRDLSKAIKDSTFRADLYYRLNVINIKMPPLRARKKDIQLLSYYFLNLYKKSLNKGSLTISPEAINVLQQYDWPGNVRELENVIERGVNLTVTDTIELSDLPPELLEAIVRSTLKANQRPTKANVNPISQSHIIHSKPNDDSATLPYDTPTTFQPMVSLPSKQQAATIPEGFHDSNTVSPEISEYNSLVKLLKEERGHVKSVAKRAGLPVSTVYSKLRKYNLNAKSFKVW